MDLRKFNARILENKKIRRFPMLTLNEIIEKISSATPKFFSGCDLTNAFLQCNLDPKSLDYFSFSKHLGNFRYTKIVYGYTQSQSIFQAQMNRILNGLLWLHCLAFLDDVIIFNTEFSDHWLSIKQVLQRFMECNVKLVSNKSTFCLPSVHYMGIQLKLIL